LKPSKDMTQALVSRDAPKTAHNHPISDFILQTSRTAPGQAPGTRKPTLPPNQTLYVSNIPSSKIQKEDLRRSLYTLFSTYGPVLDVVALRTMKMRGQAHIVYRDIQTATQAMRALQGFEFFGKEMVCRLEFDPL
jgi:RNA recognition motif-containing protein